ncbi:type III-A CRISPR-associated protein Cas10/Csm1 [Methanotorris formicicus]|uniref:CRISPR system single-strand-specific deoxyribonuclease Cas10/Csm1 (subtype III-A) n=1 Tax=Methanotorris formicicus Mc-S-70 TaxID=647171 RepID=H1KYT2_9EURY|nr:type III-A CRISPR-associated protein Cas10/Csm1 [Methanotorris formicicus]EHP86829.1 CRISPR-associated protein, Csm1 family [Methanotorris formicicus Mc-S-70]
MRDYEALKIGSLLHDIGKFIQRAKYNPKKKKHVDFGYEFLEGYLKDDNCKLNILKNLNDKDRDLVLDIIRRHHDQSINEGIIGIVRLADWLSSAERENTDEELSIPKDEQALLSVFELVDISDDKFYLKKIKEKKEELYGKGKKYNLKPLSIQDHVIFPYPSPNISYEDLHNSFMEELKKVNIDNFEKLYQLIQKYFWCIPSATNWRKGGSLPDISLFDHLKTTCAIASCLYKIYEKSECKGKYADAELTDDMLRELLKKIPLEKGKYKKGSNPAWEKYGLFSLIHGDISGIQNFIFKITSKYATKSLKGRSFYLDFLTEMIANHIIQNLDLPITNILFCGGGHFYILSYKVKDECIDEFEKEINEMLYGKFRIDLYITLGKADIKPYEFLSQSESNFSKKWREVGEITAKRKMRKFYYKIEDLSLFKPYGRCDENKICRACRGEFKRGICLYGEEGDKLCENCYSFVELIDFLKEFKDKGYISFNYKKPSKAKVEGEKKRKEITIKELPTLKDLFEKIKLENEEYNLPDNNGNLELPYKIWSIAFPLKDVGENNENKKEIKDFNELAEQAKERTGTNKIGILKMDVDNLGKVFTEGLGDFASISRMSTLSSMLTLFFTGYIPHLIETGKCEIKDKEVYYKDNVYLVYSGGDDTLIVGAWDVIWELAKEIRKKFKKFTCYNPNLSLSAGVVLVSPKFEFKKAVELADEELDDIAKDDEIIVPINGEKEVIKKNAVSIFGCPLSWDFEVYYDEESIKKFEDFYSIKHNKRIEIDKKIKEFVKKYNETELEECFEKAIREIGKKRVLHITQEVGDRLNRAIECKGEEFLINFPYYWRILYYLHRNYKKGKNNLDNNIKFLEDYVKEKISYGFKCRNIRFNDLKVSARIAELKNREG